MTPLVICSGPVAHAADVEARLTQAGMDFIAAEIPKFLPSSIPVGGGTLFSTSCPWGGDPFSLSVANLKVANIEFPSAELGTARGKITVGIEAADIETEGVLKVTHALCLGGPLDCDFVVRVSHAQVSVSFVPQIQGKGVKLLQPAINTIVAPFDVIIDVSNCGNAGEVLDKAEAVIHRWFVDQLKGWLEDMAIAEVPAEIEKTLSSATTLGNTGADYKFEANFEKVQALNEGLHISGTMAIDMTVDSPCEQSPRPPPAKSGNAEPVMIFNGDHVGIAMSEATVKNALHASWKGGWLCWPYSKLKALGWHPQQLLNAAGVLLGLISIDSVDAWAPNAPDVKLLPGTPGRAEAEFPGFTIVANGEGPNGPVKITAIADIGAEADIGIHPENRAVSLINAKGAFSNLQLFADNPDGLTMSQELFKDLLKDVVLPVVEGAVSGLALLPHTYPFGYSGPLKDYLLYLTRSTTTEDYGYTYGKLFKVADKDDTPPETTIETKVPPLLKPKMFKVVADGKDDATPEELLSYTWRVGGEGEWSEIAWPYYNRRAHVVELVHGTNIVEVKAVDLHRNEDPTPAKIEIEVDGESPELTVEPPPPTIYQPSVRISFTVSDGNTPPDQIKVMLQLLHEAEAGLSEVVREDPFIKGVQAVRLSQLVRGRYTVTLVAEDAVGNRSDPVSHSFTADIPEGEGGDPEQPGGNTVWEPAPQTSKSGGRMTGGCQIAGPRPSDVGALLLGLCAIIWFGRRRQP